MRFRNAGQIEMGKFFGEKLMTDDNLFYGVRSGLHFIALRSQQVIAAAFRHAATFRSMPGGGVSRGVGKAGFGGQHADGHHQKGNGDEKSPANNPREEFPPALRISSRPKQDVYPRWHLP